MRDLGNPRFGEPLGKIWLAVLVVNITLFGILPVPQVFKALAGALNLLLVGIFIGPRLCIWGDDTAGAVPPSDKESGPAVQQDIAAIARDKGFYGANHLGKMQEELAELEENPGDATEMADLFLALLLHADGRGVDLMQAAAAKIDIVKGRSYGPPDENGVMRHVSG